MSSTSQATKNKYSFTNKSLSSINNQPFIQTPGLKVNLSLQHNYRNQPVLCCEVETGVLTKKKPRHYIILIDKSGSMSIVDKTGYKRWKTDINNSDNRLEKTKRLCYQLIDRMDPIDYVTIISFDKSSTIELEKAQIKTAKSKVIEVIKAIRVGSGTYFDHAFKSVKNIMENKDLAIKAKDTTILFITDGQDTCDPLLNNYQNKEYGTVYLSNDVSSFCNSISTQIISKISSNNKAKLPKLIPIGIGEDYFIELWELLNTKSNQQGFFHLSAATQFSSFVNEIVKHGFGYCYASKVTLELTLAGKKLVFNWGALRNRELRNNIQALKFNVKSEEKMTARLIVDGKVTQKTSNITLSTSSNTLNKSLFTKNYSECIKINNEELRNTLLDELYHLILLYQITNNLKENPLQQTILLAFESKIGDDLHRTLVSNSSNSYYDCPVTQNKQKTIHLTIDDGYSHQIKIHGSNCLYLSGETNLNNLFSSNNDMVLFDFDNVMISVHNDQLIQRVNDAFNIELPGNYSTFEQIREPLKKINNMLTGPEFDIDDLIESGCFTINKKTINTEKALLPFMALLEYRCNTPYLKAILAIILINNAFTNKNKHGVEIKLYQTCTSTSAYLILPLVTIKHRSQNHEHFLIDVETMELIDLKDDKQFNSNLNNYKFIQKALIPEIKPNISTNNSSSSSSYTFFDEHSDDVCWSDDSSDDDYSLY